MFKNLSKSFGDISLIKFIRDLWEITHLNTDKQVNISYGLSDIPEEYQKKEFSKNEIKILMITDFSEFLDNHTAIFAVNECNKEGMYIQLDIYGQGRDLDKIQNCIGNQHCPNIQYKGGFQDFTTIYKDYDLFVTASYSCDIQMNTIEAMRAGLPLLLMDVKGNGESEFIKGNGYLMPENAIMHFRKTLKGFYDNKSQLISMGQNSRKLYEGKYTAQTMIDKTLDAYKEVLGE